MRGLLWYSFVFAVLPLATQAVHAQDASLPSIILTAAPDVPQGLLARMRGELAAAGVMLATNLQTQQGAQNQISIIIRQSEGELVAELAGLDEQGSTQSRALSVPFVPGDFADVAEAGSELAVRTAEILRTELASRKLNLEPVAAVAAAAPLAIAKAAKPSVAPQRTAAPPWLITAGLGVASGLVSGQNQIISEINVAHVWRAGWFGSLGFMFPFSNATVAREQGTVSAEAYVATIDGGMTRKLSQRWRASYFASAGLALTNIKGNGAGPFLSNSAAAYAFMAAAGGNIGLTIAPNVVLLFQGRLMTLQPRPGIRVENVEAATAAWILPSGTMALGVVW